MSYQYDQPHDSVNTSRSYGQHTATTSTGSGTPIRGHHQQTTSSGTSTTQRSGGGNNRYDDIPITPIRSFQSPVTPQRPTSSSGTNNLNFNNQKTNKPLNIPQQMHNQQHHHAQGVRFNQHPVTDTTDNTTSSNGRTPSKSSTGRPLTASQSYMQHENDETIEFQEDFVKDAHDIANNMKTPLPNRHQQPHHHHHQQQPQPVYQPSYQQPHYDITKQQDDIIYNGGVPGSAGTTTTNTTGSKDYVSSLERQNAFLRDTLSKERTKNKELKLGYSTTTTTSSQHSPTNQQQTMNSHQQYTNPAVGSRSTHNGHPNSSPNHNLNHEQMIYIDENEFTRKRLNELNEKIDSQEEEISDNLKLIDQHVKTITRIEKEKKKLIENEHQLLIDLGRSEREKQQLQIDNDTALEIYEQTSASFSDEKSRYEDTIRNLQYQLQSQKTAISDKDTLYTDLTMDYNKLANAYDQQASQINKQKQELSTIAQELTLLKLEITKLNQQSNDLSSDLKEKVQQYKQQSQQLEESKQTINQLQLATNKSKSYIDQKDKQYADAIKQNELKLQQYIDRIHQLSETIKIKDQNLHNSNLERTKQLSEFTANYEKLREQYNTSETEKDLQLNEKRILLNQSIEESKYYRDIIEKISPGFFNNNHSRQQPSQQQSSHQQQPPRQNYTHQQPPPPTNNLPQSSSSGTTRQQSTSSGSGSFSTSQLRSNPPQVSPGRPNYTSYDSGSGSGIDPRGNPIRR